MNVWNVRIHRVGHQDDGVGQEPVLDAGRVMHLAKGQPLADLEVAGHEVEIEAHSTE